MNDEKVIEHLTRIKSESGAIAKFQVDDIINNIQEHVTRAEQVAKQGSSGKKWDPLPPMPSGLGAAAGRAVLDSADDEGNCPICFEYMDPQGTWRIHAVSTVNENRRNKNRLMSMVNNGVFI